MSSYKDNVKKTYDKISKKYHKITPKHFFNAYLEVPATTSLIDNVKGKNVLDLGCGTGMHTKILKRRGADVWGLDISPKMIEIARNDIKGVDFKVGSANKLPYKPKFFDIVVAGLCVSYFKNLDKALKEVYRVLKKDGIFVFSIPNPLLEISSHIKGKPYNYRVFKDYFKEGKTHSRWPTFKVNIPYYHRTFQTLVRAIVRNKFVIEDFVDAKPVKEGKKVNPDAYKTYSKIPHFSIFKVRKRK
jgi:ubiquinone/menaquinone biosynthesis C-methylase UbiE